MPILFGAASVLIVLVSLLFLGWKACSVHRAPSPQRDDKAGKLLMQRTRYALNQNSVPAEADTLNVIKFAITARVSGAPAGAVPEPANESSSSPSDTPQSDRPGDDAAIAKKTAARQMPRSIARRRNDPIGQQAMAYAIRHPEPGRRGVRNTELSELANQLGIKKRSLNDRIYKARLVLRYNQDAVPLVMNGALSLWKAHDKALDLRRRKNAEMTDQTREKSQPRYVGPPSAPAEFAKAA
ncbi:hypothetical protein [Taklimakanibacter deserti]|uniref:hypothetical protein n=1 Tax=Taklimakanibacter deserti TaxID=2267839 RepID=UPI000E64BA50